MFSALVETVRLNTPREAVQIGREGAPKFSDGRGGLRTAFEQLDKQGKKSNIYATSCPNIQLNLMRVS